MRILVDTCVWSKAFRSVNPDQKQNMQEMFNDLIANHQIFMIGAIRQEVLSGIKSEKRFRVLKKALRCFNDLELDQETFELAAEYYNLCKSKGVNGGQVDFLICAAAIQHKCELLTMDKDFTRFSKHLPIKIQFIS